MKIRDVEILGNNVTHKKGFAFKSDWFKPEGYPIVKVTNFTDNSIDDSKVVFVDDNIYSEHLEYSLKVGDVVIQTVGSWPNNPESVVGKVVKVPNRLNGALLNQNAVVLYPKNRIDRGFFYYLLKSDNFKGYIINTAQGAANQASITLDSIFRYNFYLPPSPIQKNIAAILSTYDDLIEINNRRIAILEKMAEELYREWFVRLRFPGHEKVKIIRGVPAGWEVKKLPEIAEITYGYPFDGSRFNDLGMGKPIIRIRNIPDSSTTDYTDEEAKDKHVVRKGDLLVGMDGEFHINHWFGEEAYLVQRSCRIKSHDSLLHGYLSKAIVAPVKFYESILQGATVGHLGAKHLNSIDILIPNSEFKSCLAVFNNLVQQKVNYSSSNNNLKLSRDRLLSRLMSGKIDVENMDIEFPASMKEELVHA